MKRGILAAALLVTLFSSCEKKEYLCTCLMNQGGNITTRKYELGKITNSTAQEKCNDIQVDLTNNGRQGAASCKVDVDQ